MQKTFIVVLIALAAALGGCVTVGPYVTRVQPLAGGAIRVRSCTLIYTYGPLGDSLKEGECTSSVLRPEAE